MWLIGEKLLNFMDLESRKKELTDLEREVTQNKGTEAPFSGELFE